MKSARKIIAIMLLAAMVLALVAGCGARPQPAQPDAPKQEAPKEKYLLKFNHVLAPTEPYHDGFLEWAKNVYDRTDGYMEVQVFPSAQLGVEEDIIEQIRAGVNVGQNTDSARLGMFIPEMAVMNAPYFVETIEEVLKLNDLPMVQEWNERLGQRYGIKVLSFNWIQGLRHFVTNKPIRTPEDLKGLRIRTPGVPIWQESVRSLGATPVALPFGEMYPAIQQGAIDGMELVYRNLTGGKFWEVARYVNETGHILLINFSIMSQKFFDSLPAEYQQILVEENAKSGLKTSRLIMEKHSSDAKQELIEKGMIIVEDVDMAAFRKAGEAAYRALNLTEVRKEIYKELGR